MKPKSKYKQRIDLYYKQSQIQTKDGFTSQTITTNANKDRFELHIRCKCKLGLNWNQSKIHNFKTEKHHKYEQELASIDRL